MARVSRKNIESKYCHIMVQGINKEYIFKEKNMKEKYLELLTKNAQKNNVKIISYCIMDNHVHILLKIETSMQISKFMSQNNTSYGKYYNQIYNRVGYVFRDRYRAEPILNESHLHNCIRYIHENPVKANMVNECSQYIFSSYNSYMNNEINKEIIKDVYGICDNYISKISGQYEDYKFIEVNNQFGENEFEDFNKVCHEYENVDFKDGKNVVKISNELKMRCNANNVEVMNFMGLKRSTYYNIIKKNI